MTPIEVVPDLVAAFLISGPPSSSPSPSPSPSICLLPPPLVSRVWAWQEQQVRERGKRKKQDSAFPFVSSLPVVCVRFFVWKRSCGVCLGLLHASDSLVPLLLLRTTFAPPGHMVRQAGGHPTIITTTAKILNKS